ncbi:unnamed protein product [Paramecium sonneborni]|uniref:VWFA domain-containing protein n=1 Tax=Paramecium sonneborni TaxID=65129 RepID=A0A8S1KRC9_9CILI|nr:unnamed protein product [Paramecium sonneborni]
MIQFNRNYLSFASINNDIQQKYQHNIPDDEVPKQCIQKYQFTDLIDIKYGYQDNKSFIFEIKKNFPKQPDFLIGVDLIYLIDISLSLNDETLEKIKCALKCLVNYLSDRDRLCIILYNNKADQLFPLIPLNQQNKQIIFEKIEQITNKKGHPSILSALLVANLCLKLRQFKNQITSINIISQEYDIGRYCSEFEQLFQIEKSFKLKCFLLIQNNLFQSSQINQRENLKIGKHQIIKNVDDLSSYLCFEAAKLQQTVITNLLIIVKSQKKNQIQISECEGGKYHYINSYEIQIKKKLVSIGYNKTHLVSVRNNKEFEAGQICDVEVSFQQLNTNYEQKYTIPIYFLNQMSGIIDEAVIVQKYKLKSRSQMKEALSYYDPYSIKSCTEILKLFQSEVANLPDCVKQQLRSETQQFEIAIQKYIQEPQKQIENPFNQIDQVQKRQQYQLYQEL